MKNAQLFAQEHAKGNVLISATMDVLDAHQPVQQHVAIFVKERVVPMNVKLHVFLIAEPIVMQIVKTIVPEDARNHVVLIIVLVDVIHRV